MNLLAKIEAELNHISKQLPASSHEERQCLVDKYQKLKALAFDYVNLEHRYKQIVQLNIVS